MLIVFDLMDTLLTDPFQAAHEAACGMSFAEFETLRPDGLYHRLERGEVEEGEYWRGLVTSGLRWDTEEFHRTRRAGYAWIDGMRDLLVDCTARHRVAIGSNYPVWIDEVVGDHLAGLDVGVFASCRLGVRKPRPEFFERLAEQAGTAVTDLILVDDKKVNVDAVTAVGGTGVHFTTAAETRAALRTAGVAGV
ncbi:HAD-IA family hydrolase [Micromonospora schwarzwaldensis]